MIDPEKAYVAVQSGLSYVCAMCELYWEARDKNVPDDLCMAKDGCGSPIAGDVFHEYKGPLTIFDKFCFACGDIATKGVRVKNLVRVIGSCDSCVDLIRELKPETKEAATLRFFDKNGQEIKYTDEDTGKVHLKLI